MFLDNLHKTILLFNILFKTNHPSLLALIFEASNTPANTQACFFLLWFLIFSKANKKVFSLYIPLIRK